MERLKHWCARLGTADDDDDVSQSSLTRFSDDDDVFLLRLSPPFLLPARTKNIADLEQRHLRMFADVVRFQEL